MPPLRQNNLNGTISDNPLLAGATTMIVSTAFPTVIAPNKIKLSIEPDTANEEVVYVTDHPFATTVATIERGQEGGVVGGIQHQQGAVWKHGPTQTDFDATLDYVVKASGYYRVKGGAHIVTDGVIYATPSGMTGGRDKTTPFSVHLPRSHNRPSPSAIFDNPTQSNVLFSNSGFPGATPGMVIVVAGAGVAGLPLITSISAVLDKEVVMAAGATGSVMGALVAYGYDDTAAVNACDVDASNAPGSPGTVRWASDNYLFTGQLNLKASHFFDGCGIVSAANLPNGMFNVLGPDVCITGRGTFYGMGTLTDGFNADGQSNFDFLAHFKAVTLGLTLPNAPAPTNVAQAGTTNLPSGSYTSIVAYVDPIGSEATAGIGTVTAGLTAGQQLQVTASGVPAGVVAVNFYIFGPAGVNSGQFATVVPTAGVAVATLTSASQGDNRLVPITNRTGNNLISAINCSGVKVDGWLTTSDSALVRTDGSSHVYVDGIHGGPFTRDPGQVIVNLGDLQGKTTEVSDIEMGDKIFVDGGSMVSKGALVVAQWSGLGNAVQIRNVRIGTASAEYMTSLGDGLDVIQCSYTTITAGNFRKCGANGVVYAGGFGCTINGGTAALCNSPGLQIGDFTVPNATSLVTVNGWISVDCGINPTFGANEVASGVFIYSPPGFSTNGISFNGIQSYRSAFSQIYGIGVGGTGSFFAGGIMVGGVGLLVGAFFPVIDNSTGAPNIALQNTYGGLSAPAPPGVAAITPTASPMIYTNLYEVPIAVYIQGGTGTTIAKNSITIFTQGAAAFPFITLYLMPRESFTITYSVAPTINADRK